MPRHLTITKAYEFDAAHRLELLPIEHKCHHLHGHTYKVEIEISGPVDPKLGWICDYAVLDESWSHLHKVLDHTYLNKLTKTPTTEWLADWIFDKLKDRLPPDVVLESVTLHESSATKARVTR